MPKIVYRIALVLCRVLRGVPLGTNLGLLHILFAMMSGRFLESRGAVFPALNSLGLPNDAVRRAESALACGRWTTADLLAEWNRYVEGEHRVRPRRYGGFTPVACDLIGFFRPRLRDNTGKHYTSQAGKALPAVVLGVSAKVGSVGNTRVAVPCLILHEEAADRGASGFQKRLVEQTVKDLCEDEAMALDRGFSLAHLLGLKNARFVVRLRDNFTARRATAAPYKGKGPHSPLGETVRPLARSYKGKTLPATEPDRIVRWCEDGREIEAAVFENLVLNDAKPGEAVVFTCVVIRDPRYKDPLVLGTNLPLVSMPKEGSITAQEAGQFYRDRWPVEQIPLAGKQMLGAERAFVFGRESRHRLPELALLAGNILSYVAASSPAVATGFWDRNARPTCGRLRRALRQVELEDLPLSDVSEGKLRKKESVTGHLLKGVKGHRRTKAVQEALWGRRRAA